MEERDGIEGNIKKGGQKNHFSLYIQIQKKIYKYRHRCIYRYRSDSHGQIWSLKQWDWIFNSLLLELDWMLDFFFLDMIVIVLLHFNMDSNPFPPLLGAWVLVSRTYDIYAYA